MTLRLTLICHGATAAARSAAFPLDEPVEDGVAAQAEALGRTLHRADRIWTSPALRARQTASLLGLDAAVEPALRDGDHGRWAGRSLADVQRAEPDGVAAWLADADAAPHGGESLADLRRRVAAWMDGRVGDRGHAIVVTHAAVIRTAILHILDAPARSFWRIDVEPLGVTDIRSDGTRWAWRAGNPAR
jgi:broad specificity phosphatase PhoE